MELATHRDDDFALTVALETDPEVMRELGGPTDRSRLPDVHRRRLDDPWWPTIVPEAGGSAAGTIGIWARDLDGETIHETGWMVLSAFQGREITTDALRLLIGPSPRRRSHAEMQPLGACHGPGPDPLRPRLM